MSQETVDSGEQKNNVRNNEIWEWVKALIIAGILALIIRTFLFEPYVVNGTSMMPTLEDGEKLIVNKMTYYFNEPERGDIIVFQATENYKYIKRVIAVEGETVSVKDDQLYINGKPVDEPYLKEYQQQFHNRSKAMDNDADFTEDFGPVKVPEGELFVMGDNRQRSQDSRSRMLGTISEETIVGRASVVFWPLNRFRLIEH